MNQPIEETDKLSADIATLAAHVLGSAALARGWLEEPAIALDGRRPADLMTSETGRQLVRELLLRIEYGVYT